jgi:anti-sigma B factor antagonist
MGLASLGKTNLNGVVWYGGAAVGCEGPKEPPSRSSSNGDFLSMLNFTTSETRGVMVMTFEANEDGATDWQTSQRDWLYKLIESHPGTRFAIDLTDVNYLASSEIGFLVTLKRRIDRRQGKVVMFGAGPYITDLFQTMNLLRFFDIADTLPSALAKLEHV